MFDRRARNPARELERRRRRPRQHETAALAGCVRMQHCGDERYQRHRADDRSQAIPAWLGPVATRVRRDLRTQRRSNGRNAWLCLGDEPAHRCSAAANITTGTSQRVSAEPFGPAMQSRVRRRPVAELAPGDLPQAQFALRVVRDLVLDDGQTVGLALQHVAGQHSDPGSASATPGQHDPRSLDNGRRLAALVELEQHQATLDRRPGQREAPARGATRVIGDSRSRAKTTSRPSTSARTRDMTLRR